MNSDNTTLEGARILLVDDTPTNLDVLSQVLETEGYDLAMAADGQSALRIASQILPELILLDVTMPVMDGFEVCRRLKQDPQLAAVPVIFVSARDQVEDVMTGFEMGGVDYITKPFREEEVLVRVATHLRLKRLSRQLGDKNRQLAEQNGQLAQTLQELEQTQNRLMVQEKMATLGSLAAGVAHELNTPLGALLSAVGVLGKGVGHIRRFAAELGPQADAQPTQRLERVLGILENDSQVAEQAATRIRDTVDRLKRFIRLDQADFQKVDVHVGLEDAVALLEHGTAPGVTLERQYGQLPQIYCYPAELNQVFATLLVHAIAAIPQGGAIGIRTWQEGEGIAVGINDSGQGLSREGLRRAFDPGFSSQQGRMGMDMGLALCHNIVQKHQGTMEVTSEPGKGTTVILRLPCRPKSAS